MNSSVDLFNAIPNSLSFLKSFGAVGVFCAIVSALWAGAIVQAVIARQKMRYEKEEARHAAAMAARRMARCCR